MLRNLKKMRPDLRTGLSIALVLAVLIHGADRVAAQPGHSLSTESEGSEAVIINFDALGLSPAEAAAAARNLAPVPRKLEKPLLTAPSPAVLPPQQSPQTTEIIAPSGRNIVSFPVEIRERSEDYDPSLPAAPARPAKKESMASEKARILAPAPLPPLKPVKTVRIPATINKTVAEVPLPPRLPAERMNAASANLAPSAPQMVRTPAVRISDASGIAMPAVPTTRVHAEKLAPGAAGLIDDGPDRLARALIVPDRNAMVESVEQVQRLANALAPIDITEKSLNEIEPASGGGSAAQIIPAAPLESIIPSERSINVPRLPPDNSGAEIDFISIPFTPDLSELDRQVAAALDGKILPLLQKNPGWRLQIQSFAAGSAEDEKGARRLSLSRALAVRKHLIGNGIDAARMDVRALGSQTDRNPPDRVDFVIFDPARGSIAGN